MSVLTDPATYGIRNSELTNCPRTAAVLGELAAQWQQMMATLQPVEQETVSSQSLANAIENINKTRIDATGATPPEEHGAMAVTLKTTSMLNWTMSWRWPWPM